MKCLFKLDGVSYLAPSKREARQFLKFFGELKQPVYRFGPTTWRFKHIERAPSYGQYIRVTLNKVEFNGI